METIGERIKLVRESAALSQREFAKNIGWTQAYISQVEAGQRENISSAYLMVVGCLYGVSVHWLKSGKGEMRGNTKEEIIGRVWLYTDDQLKKLVKFMDSIENNAQVRARIEFKERLRSGKAAGAARMA